ncbi:MAG: sulfurtransferase [Thermoplasmata archaeon]|nr:sulfurtransferase [Thermoplasmata archaeon]
MVEAITPEELAPRLRAGAGAPFLLDVREDEEREVARIEPSLHIPMAEVPARKEELPKDREVVVYCHHGGRSQMVAAYLEQEGFTQVSNLTGGIDAWAQRIDPKVARYR